MHTHPSKALVSGAIIAVIFSLMPAILFAHCQVPCGIYDDHARIVAMLEDTATIEKAVKQIQDLAGKTDPQSLNQQVRWVMTKETHAENIIRTMSDYYLTQRVKPDQKDYTLRLERHHAVMLAAMSAKQKVDEQTVLALRKTIEALEAYYPEHTH